MKKAKDEVLIMMNEYEVKRGLRGCWKYIPNSHVKLDKEEKGDTLWDKSEGGMDKMDMDKDGLEKDDVEVDKQEEMREDDEDFPEKPIHMDETIGDATSYLDGNLDHGYVALKLLQYDNFANDTILILCVLKI
ncbi:hypothetical protein R1flu_016111 [Riccia fluitans]|uniref:Uncharacterized protein n=1 Tax=Riccia fluitans TaxID=41844 RepID=A0ABD1YL99_9MARC